MPTYWCDLPRDVLLVSGADALTFLQSQISQDIRDLADGDSAYSFVLQPTGKVEALIRIHRRSAEVLMIDTDAGFGEALTARLNRFRVRVEVDIESVPRRCIAVRGSVPLGGGLPAWGLDDAFDLIGDDPQPPGGAREGSADELLLARIEAGWPAMGREITDATIPAEVGHVVALAVSFSKGCYPGQELVERMDSRGSAAPRFMRRLRGSGTASEGDDVEHGGKTVGAITSLARSDDGWVALANIGRAVQPGETVTVGAGEAVVEEIGAGR